MRRIIGLPNGICRHVSYIQLGRDYYDRLCCTMDINRGKEALYVIHQEWGEALIRRYPFPLFLRQRRQTEINYEHRQVRMQATTWIRALTHLERTLRYPWNPPQ